MEDLVKNQVGLGRAKIKWSQARQARQSPGDSRIGKCLLVVV